ncbi:MAG: hypothetical protein HY097_07340, partial [Nitrospinae bacterium]|nr:hypothetical protein [Nitrospinota bacterium]
MERLAQRDIQALMEAIRKIYSETDIEALPNRIASEASKVIPSATTCFCKIIQNNRNILDIEMSSHGNKWESPDTFKRCIHEHPFVNLLYSGKIKPHPFREDIERAILRRFPDFKRFPENIALKISDAFTDRQLRRLKLFNEFFHPNGIEYMLGAAISYRQNFHTAICFSRDRKDFTEKERLILNLLSPHIGQAYRNAKAGGLIRKHESFGLTPR